MKPLFKVIMSCLIVLLTGCTNQATKKMAETTIPCYMEFPEIDQESFKAYDAYQTWRIAQKPGSSEYNGYLNWLEYQEYLRLSQ